MSVPEKRTESTNTEVVTPTLKRKPVYEFFKRLFDFFVSLFILIILFPVLLLIALFIYIDDPKGSPIFTQTRIGKDGKPFKLYKFRTMQVGAEDMLDDLLDQNEADGAAFKIKDDPRITRLGSLLRKTSIDEFPQFFNVLRGDMSLVGPRPPLEREVELYTPHQMGRLLVTPGLTCIWQIQKDRNDIPFDQWVDLDLEYIQNRNMGLDIKLIFQTMGAMLGGNGR